MAGPEPFISKNLRPGESLCQSHRYSVGEDDRDRTAYLNETPY